MEQKVKHQIYKMLIWWLIKRILPSLREITWWDGIKKITIITNS